MKSYISYSELLRTDTGIDNELNSTEFNTIVSNLTQLRLVLNMIRGFMRQPLRINSGYRSHQVNLAVGGVLNSKHLAGLAADITCDDLNGLKLVCYHLFEQGILTEYVPHETYIHVAI